MASLSFDIHIEPQIWAHCPMFCCATIACKVKNTTNTTELWQEIDTTCADIRSSCDVSAINKLPTISATRQIYKALGKDPNRYRPSAESLRRRVVKGMELYRIDALVDLINLASLTTGYSIGGFDADKIEGEVITLGVGQSGEPFEGIGRGPLNIEGLPVYRDKVGGIGTPTSDNERTKISLDTQNLFMIINGYSGKSGLQEAIAYIKSLLIRYANASEISVCIHTNEETYLD